jgi:hypothetical protein
VLVFDDGTVVFDGLPADAVARRVVEAWSTRAS